jgi:uncharacterized protein (DUF1800 family)
MSRLSPLVEHLLRRAGFGATDSERTAFAPLNYTQAVDALLNYDPAKSDVVDTWIGTPGYVGITTHGQFTPNMVINDARQRWIFRMVHSPAPLQEKMSLLWHQHFATAYSKIAGAVGASDGTRMVAAKPTEDPGGARGQIELFRQYALGSFRDLLIQVAQDPAMLVWLDGRTNFRAMPQENFGRELMELFTVGVANYVETDVYAAARVFTGWNLTTTGTAGTAAAFYAFNYNEAQHETAAKDFSFPIFPNGSKRIPSRSAASGYQDGIDLISALAFHPETAKRLAGRLWTWFVSEIDAPDPTFIANIANVYLQNNTFMKPVIRAVLLSPQFMDPQHFYARYAWPSEFVVRALKEVGYVGFSVNDAITPMLNMGQQLYEPPNVGGWVLGPGWFSTGGMLSRMNFASALATNQKFALRTAAGSSNASPEALAAFELATLTLPTLDPSVNNALLAYLRAGGPWTGSDTQLLSKAAGLVHLLAGSGDYQFV